MKTFAELSLSPGLMRAIADLKYETPSAIQAQALPILLGKPTDFIGLAATGTGKTAAFAIPILERIVGRFLVLNFPEIFETTDSIKHRALTGDEPHRQVRREHREQRNNTHYRGKHHRKPFHSK